MGGEAGTLPALPRIDFLGGALAKRIRPGGGKEPLLRAVGLREGRHVEVVDATAGMGRDAFVLAAAGAKVTLIERSRQVFDLLDEALATARRAGGRHAEAVSRMELVHGDARELLPGLDPTVILVDPMHPAQRNSALRKLDIRALRTLVGSDPDRESLIEAALTAARDRVALKWPAKAPLPEHLPRPTFELAGRSIRFCVFVNHGSSTGRAEE
jgi:16S rRNA (guanine1516-N2)-methyltransferase